MSSPPPATCPYCRRSALFPGETPEAASEVNPGAEAAPACPVCGRRGAGGFVPAAGPQRQAACRLCAAPLTPLEAVQGTVCSRNACRQQQLGEEAAARRNAQRQFAHAMSERGERLRAEASDLPADQPISLAIVPVNMRSVGQLPEHRKQAFLAHLRRVMVEEQQSREKPLAELTTPYSVPQAVEPSPSPAQDRLLGLACAVCRGHCCRQGVEHAFHDVPSMRRIRQSVGPIDDNDLLARYAELLPQLSYEDSCVFHTERGCNLPREMRADMCNTWMCAGQHRWLEELPREEPLLGYVVATPDYEPIAIRAALVGVGIVQSETLLLEDPSAADQSGEAASD